MTEPPSASAAATLKCWRTHNRWLCLFALGSILAGALCYVAARGPDGRDPFYVAVAIEFAAWGSINVLFGLSGERDASRTRRSSPEAVIDKGRTIVRLLVFNRWLNALWLTMGVALLAWGEAVASASLCGHGVSVLFQGASLTIADEFFLHRLRRAVSAADDDPLAHLG